MREALKKALDECRRKGKTRRDFARQCAIGTTTLWQWESGQSQPTAYKLQAIVQCLRSWDREIAMTFVYDVFGISVHFPPRRESVTPEVALHLAMREHMLSAYAVGKAIGVTQVAVLAWCDGRSVPTFSNLLKLRELFGNLFLCRLLGCAIVSPGVYN